jgi:hypothetical protein
VVPMSPKFVRPWSVCKRSAAGYHVWAVYAYDYDLTHAQAFCFRCQARTSTTAIELDNVRQALDSLWESMNDSLRLSWRP